MTNTCKFKSDITFIQWTGDNEESVAKWLALHELYFTISIEFHSDDCYAWSKDNFVKLKEPEKTLFINTKHRTFMVKSYHYVVLLPNDELKIYDEQTFNETFEVVE